MDENSGEPQCDGDRSMLGTLRISLGPRPPTTAPLSCCPDTLHSPVGGLGQATACIWGSTQRAKREARVVRMPFWTLRSSVGSPWADHRPTSTSSVSSFSTCIHDGSPRAGRVRTGPSIVGGAEIKTRNQTYRILPPA